VRIIRLLFVDDQPLVLRSIERTLRSLRPSWDVTYATSANNALAVLERDPVDIVVSDIGMPDIDGMMFLRAVRGRFPQITRMVLSSEARSTDRMQGILETHQWIAKPCPVRELVRLIEAAYEPRRSIEDAETIAAICGLACLPSQLAFYRAAVHAVERRAPLDELIALIEHDVGMAAKVIQLVNSGFFAAPRRITSVAQAAVALGVDTLRSVLVAAETRYHPDVEDVTARSIDVAALAFSFATAHHDDVQLAGLLHDIATLAWDPTQPPRPPVVDGSIAALLLATWGLPAEVVNAVAFHRDPNGAPDPREHRLCCVALAAALVTELRVPGTPPAIVDARSAALGLDPAICRARALRLAVPRHEPGMSSTMPSTTLRPRSTR